MPQVWVAYPSCTSVPISRCSVPSVRQDRSLEEGVPRKAEIAPTSAESEKEAKGSGKSGVTSGATAGWGGQGYIRGRLPATPRARSSRAEHYPSSTKGTSGNGRLPGYHGGGYRCLHVSHARDHIQAGGVGHARFC